MSIQLETIKTWLLDANVITEDVETIDNEDGVSIVVQHILDNKHIFITVDLTFKDEEDGYRVVTITTLLPELQESVNDILADKNKELYLLNELNELNLYTNSVNMSLSRVLTNIVAVQSFLLDEGTLVKQQFLVGVTQAILKTNNIKELVTIASSPTPIVLG